MINLLPPDIKQQIVFSKRNAILLHYIILVVIVAVVSGAGIVFGMYHLQNQITATEQTITSNNQKVESAKEVEAKAKSINARLAAIQKIQDGQSKFSLLLKDIADVMPTGTAIESIALDGDDKKPVRISGTAHSYEAAAVVASSLAKSDRVKESRTENIEFLKEKRVYRFTVSVTFKPGQSR